MNVRKKALSLLLAAIISLPFCAPAAGAADNSFTNFAKTNEYSEGLFRDVAEDAWYRDNVALAYELGLMKGTGAAFNVSGDVSVAEAVALSARLHSVYSGDGARFQQGGVWYRVYVDYALENGIIDSEYENYERAATRAEFAVILSRALPAAALDTISTVRTGIIPDVSLYADYADAVYTLYRAGILMGDDEYGTFRPDSPIARSSAAAIITRMAAPALRRAVALKKRKVELTKQEVIDRCLPAVFLLKTYDSMGGELREVPAFFLNSTGLAAVRYQFVSHIYSAQATLLGTEETYEVKGCCGCDKTNDFALIQVEGTGFSYLDLGDAEDLQPTDPVYLIGSQPDPANLVSKAVVWYNGLIYGETLTSDMAINRLEGSNDSFCLLVDRYGRAAGLPYGPDDQIVGEIILDHITRGECKSFLSLFLTDDSVLAAYPGFDDVPDFGALFALDLLAQETAENSVTYYYSLAQLQACGLTYDWEWAYIPLLKERGYTRSGVSYSGQRKTSIYTDLTGRSSRMITVAETTYEDMECIAVTITG